jgi:hypothetical protein
MLENENDIHYGQLTRKGGSAMPTGVVSEGLVAVGALATRMGAANVAAAPSDALEDR